MKINRTIITETGTITFKNCSVIVNPKNPLSQKQLNIVLEDIETYLETQISEMRVNNKFPFEDLLNSKN